MKAIQVPAEETCGLYPNTEHDSTVCPGCYTAKRKVIAEGTEEGPWKLDELIAGKGKSVFCVETETTFYVANDLDTAMKLWRDASFPIPGKEGLEDDSSKVINVSRLG